MRRHLAVGARSILVALLAFLVLLPLLSNSGAKKATQSWSKTKDQQAFIKQIAPLAQELGGIYGVKPSILIAQASLETDYGSNLIGGRYKNLYALTAQAHQGKVTLLKETTVKGKTKTEKTSYAIYPDYRSSMIDYLERLKDKQLGKENFYQSLLATKSYKEAATTFILGGYTANRHYPDQLVKIIETHKLDSYDETQSQEKSSSQETEESKEESASQESSSSEGSSSSQETEKSDKKKTN